MQCYNYIYETEESLLVRELAPHLLTSTQMWTMGYPMGLGENTGDAAFYVNPPSAFRKLNANAREFIPGWQSDSGESSDGSSPRADSDEDVDLVERLCVRCDKRYQTTSDGQHVVNEACMYHWGRIGRDSYYTCCRLQYGSSGCSLAKFHVWSGTTPGMNGPVEGYVQATAPRGGIYGIDAEMCFTTAGLELASIVIIDVYGQLVYKSLVKPSSEVIDYNTRFSGIRFRDLARANKTLRDVQNEILEFIGYDTILIGHAVENDLRALKLIHGLVIDTAAVFPHARGFPFRRSLKALSEEFLERVIQNSTSGHSPLEDAQAAMDLVILKIKESNPYLLQMLNHQSHVP